MKLLKLLSCLVCLLPAVSHAGLSVFACEPEWGALVQELAGKEASVRVATTALQDPHHVQARPSLIAAVRRADLVVCTGAELEIGWLPLLLRSANNPNVLPGTRGYFEAASQVRMLEVPTVVDRSQGDVHPEGNPHIQTDPRNILAVAKGLEPRLEALDPAHGADYRQRLANFSTRWQAAIGDWEARAKPVQNMQIVVQHKNWAYLIQWLGLKEVATLEPKPGVPPSGAFLAAIAAQMHEHPAQAVVRAAYQDPEASRWLTEHTGIPEVMLPFTVGGTEGAKDLFGLFNDTINRLLGVTHG